MLGIVWLLLSMTNRSCRCATRSFRAIRWNVRLGSTISAASIETSSIAVRFVLKSDNALAVTLHPVRHSFQKYIIAPTVSALSSMLPDRSLACMFRWGVWNPPCRLIVLKQLVVRTASASTFSKVMRAFEYPRNKKSIIENRANAMTNASGRYRWSRRRVGWYE